MSPSSLIFVAVIAIWATYLVVHVARRREYLATARSVDRFSSQMRVLQRRAVSYTPPANRTRTPSSSLARPRPLVAAGTVFSDVEAPRPAVSAEAAPAVELTSVAPVDAPSATTVARPAGPSRASRLGGLVLALAAVVALVGAVLAGFGLLTWLVPVVVAGGTAVALRRAAVARRQAARRAAAAERRRRERAQEQARRAAFEARPSAPSLPVAQEYVAPRPQPAQRVASDPLEVAGLVGDVAIEAPTRAIEVAPTRTLPALPAAQAEPQLDPLYGDAGWDPTPVPPPTYTLKARAEHPLPPPRDVPVPIEVETEDIAWDAERGQPRVVAG